MFKTLTTAAFLGAAALPAAALDLNNLSDAERDAFRAEVRAYLLDNPGVIMEAVEILEKQQQAAASAHDFSLVKSNREAIFNDGYSFVGGNPEGDITLVEFVDYRCGYCRKAHDEVKQLVEMDGNIRLIYKEFPILGEDSLASSRFAIAVKQVAGDEAYALVHDALITFNGDVTETAMTRLSDALGFDTDAVLAQMQSESVTAEIAQTRALAQKLAISGTPTFVLEDQLLRGYMPLAGMQALVDEKRNDG
ncbi:DsbA family protein [Shimia sp. FJ5]|uniref:DsbA family protein n=1 Tax=Shimia sp. FJ5 TaxID=3079054 RepID=UPI00260A8143|nr:DsbA family protein [Shimia sp. FJ5]MDV4143994.1 DsbA family protein [Shimia sp. FJ5]